MFSKLTRFESKENTTPGTTYYKASYAQVKACVEAYAKSAKMKMKVTDEARKEILLKRNSVEIMVLAFGITPLETAVDVLVLTPVTLPAKKVAKAFFQALARDLQVK